MSVPFIDLNRGPRAAIDAVQEAVIRVLEHRQFILGPEVEAFEQALSHWLDGAHVVGVSSGTDALLAGLMALDVKPGDRVVTTPFSFFSTAGVVVRLGAVPVFVDIEPVNFGMDPARLEDLPRDPPPKAILPVHLFGHTVGLDLFLDFAKNETPVFEDAAQAIGSRDAFGRLAGTIGRLGAFSFFPTKNLGAAGDAGMLATHDPDLAARLRRLRAHGQDRQYHHVEVGGNFRIDTIQAAAITATLPFFDAAIQARRENAARYREAFQAAGLVGEHVILPAIGKGHTVHQYVVRITGGRRDAVHLALKRAEIGSAIYYPIPFHHQPCFAGLGYRLGDFPEAERASAEVLALPIFPGLTSSEQEEVVLAIERVLS